MVKIALQFKACLEGITKLEASGEDFRWYLKIKCNSCGTDNDNWIYITLLETQPLKGGRGTAHFVAKCKLCQRENSISIVEDQLKPYNFEDNLQFKTMVVFDCRGIEPIDFDPRSGFTAIGKDSGTPFTDIDLNSKEWTDYDEKEGIPVSIFEMEHQFKKL